MVAKIRGTPTYDEETSTRKWLILFGSFGNNLVIWGLAWGAGVFQVVFMEEFGAWGSVGIVSFIPTLISSWTCLVGPISSMLTNRFGCRSITWAGALVASTGLALTSLASELWHLAVTFTLLGMGAGVAYIPGSVVILCDYFERNRPLVLSMAGCGVPVGTFVIPPLIRVLINRYHWRGACLILAAIVLNIGVFASLFTPVQRKHANGSGSEAEHEAGVSRKKKLLRVKMLRQIPFLCLVMNNILVMYGLMEFYIHLPSYLESAGYSHETSTGFVSVVGVATLFGRIGCGLVAQRIRATDIIYASTVAFSGLILILLPHVRNFGVLVVLCALFGLTSCTLGPLLPLIVTDLVGIEALSDAYGYLMVAEGIGSLAGPPIAGFLYDISGSYGISMGSSGLVIVVSSIFMLVPIWHTRHAQTSGLKMSNGKPSSMTMTSLLSADRSVNTCS